MSLFNKICSKKLLLIFSVCMAMHFAVSSQVAVDIFDPFYEDAKIWEDIGLITDAPSLKPYPLPEVKHLLEEVIEAGDEGQARRAEEYYKRFFGKAYHLGGGGDLAFKFPNAKRELVAYPSAEINWFIFPILSICANISGIITNKTNKTALHPLFSTAKYDVAEDNVKAGSVYILPGFNSGVAIGNSEYYFSAAISRTHFGAFFDDSIFISKNSFHQGQFNFVVNRTKWSYTQSFLTLTSTDDFRENRKPNKFLSFHSLEIKPLTWISFGIVDSIVYGNRFEPIYFLPFSAFFISQGLYDFPDNSLIGLTFSILPYKGWRFDMALNADDLGFNEIVKFKKDAKWRMSGQFGLSYTMPRTHWFSYIKLDYTLVTPYTYAHVYSHKGDASNYSNYTHNGGALATELNPNSDRLSFRLKFRPKYGIDLDFFNHFVRHGNIAESIEDTEILKDYFAKHYNTDGSHFSHATITSPKENGETQNKTHAFLYSTPFMKQNTIQYVNQLGFLLSFHLPILKSGGKMLFSLGYTFEADVHSGVGKPIFSPNTDFFSGWNDKSIEDIAKDKGLSKEEIEAQIMSERDRQLDKWRESALQTAFNHYLRMSFKITY